MNKARILLVEDDVNLGFVIKDNLVSEGFKITHCENGLDAKDTFEKEDFDLCILDVMLPGLDGFNLAKFIRSENHLIPILFLTARDNESDILEGFQLGGDDYITKPFSIKELIMRGKSISKKGFL